MHQDIARTSNANRASMTRAALLYGAALPLALLAAPTHAQDAADGHQAGSEPPSGGFGEIIVTATRKDTVLSRTPISITAKSQEELDAQGVRSIADIASITPSISFGQTTVAYGTGQSAISIRGVSSQSGIPTTGIYINDTPVQVRIGVSPSLGNTYPQVFDLERVEVLQGPQGTLFGSGSVGGAVRFITPGPSYDRINVYGRTEIATTQNGSPSYEAGIAFGAPFVEDKVGIRVSGSYRHDGGYVDRLDPYTNELVDKDSNASDAMTLRAALGFRLGETLTVTPSIFYQDLRVDDTSRFVLAASDRDSGDLRNNLNHRAEEHRDTFSLPALKVELDLGAAKLISDTSYFHRTTQTINDDTSLSFYFSGGIVDQPFPAGFEDYMPFTDNDTKQTATTQELRLVDNDDTDRLNWIVGLFYQKSFVRDGYMASDPRLLDVLNLFLVDIGEPPFASLTESFFGTELVDGNFSVVQRNESRDKQYAAYGQVDYEIIDRLTLTAGLRYTIAKFDFDGFVAGPIYATDGQSDSAETTSKTFTPKFGISFQADRNNLFYANASKGVRGPGIAPPVGANCIDDAAAIGFDPFATLPVNPDSIWSYEVGSKNRLFGGKVAIDAAAYRINWKNVQQLFALPQCTIQTTLNLGSAKIDGFDLAVSAKPVFGLTVGASVAYINARYTTAIPGPDDTIVRQSGEPFSTIAPWTVQLNGEYVAPVGDAEIYGRADFIYSSRITDPIDVTSPLVDPELPRPPATSQLDVRLGTRFAIADGADADVSLFVNNVTNRQPLLNLFHEGPGSQFYRSSTFRPRTVGLTLTVKN